MRRREFLGLFGVAAATVRPFSLRAQPAMPVIGFLSGRSQVEAASTSGAFRRGLSEAGYVEGKNVAIEYRWAEGHYDRLPEMAAELVGRQVAVIFASGGAELAAKASTATIPIVFTTGGDPVELGLVTSLNRPSGNLTGVTFLASDLGAKRLELLRQYAPNAKKISMLMNPTYQPTAAELRDVQGAALTLGLQINVLNANTSGEIDKAFAALERERPDALIVGGDPILLSHRDQIVPLAASHTLPTIYPQREYVDAGGLMSYGTSLINGYRNTGVYTGKILAGTMPAALPVLQPTKFDLIVNLKTAKVLGLATPNALLVGADEVIE
jgi:putative ABC transport system substrate-binding protein